MNNIPSTTGQARRKKTDHRSQYDSIEIKNTSITNNSSFHDPLLMNSKQLDDLMPVQNAHHHNIQMINN